MDISPTSSTSCCNHNDQQWRIGQVVDVQPRTWAGINRQGGTGKITAIHENGHVDIKYILSGYDKNLPPHLVTLHAVLERTTRRQPPQRTGGVDITENETTEMVSRSTRVVAKGKSTAQRKAKPFKTAHKRSKKLATAAASSVRSTPSVCSSTASSIVTYVPKEIAVPVTLQNNSDATFVPDQNPPLFSPLTVAGATGGWRKKKTTASTTMASTSSSAGDGGGGPPSVIEECYMSDDNEPSALERTTTATTPNTDGPSAMMLDSPCNDNDVVPNEDLSTEPPCTTTRNKLRDVYDDDRKNAREFIESVVESSQDFNQFSSLLNQALLQNDGALDLADIAHHIDIGGGKTYSDDLIQHYLQHLCAQNKIMRSDDVIYSM